MVIESERAAFDRIRRTRACYRCGASPEHCDCPDENGPELGDEATEPESPSERAAWNVDLATADLILAVTQCRTTDDALRLRAFVEPLILKLQAVESACLLKADDLSGASQ